MFSRRDFGRYLSLGVLSLFLPVKNLLKKSHKSTHLPYVTQFPLPRCGKLLVAIGNEEISFQKDDRPCPNGIGIFHKRSNLRLGTVAIFGINIMEPIKKIGLIYIPIPEREKVEGLTPTKLYALKEGATPQKISIEELNLEFTIEIHNMFDEFLLHKDA